MHDVTSPEIRADRAPTSDGAPTITVSFADLDVSHPSGAKILYRRIQYAARAVCDLHMTSDLHRKAMQRECFNTAVENAVRDANQQQIFA